MVSGINRNSSAYDYQAIQAQYRSTPVSQRGESVITPVTPVKPVPAARKSETAVNDSLSYVKSYSSAMTDLMASANSLQNSNTASSINQPGNPETDTANAENIAASMEKLVTSYNKTYSLLSENQNRGAGTSGQLQKLGSVVSDSRQSLDKLGISVQTDGTLSLNKGKLLENVQKDPEITKDLIGGAFGLAQRAYTSAQKGLSTPASSLIKNDIAKQQQNTVTSPTSFMNTYTRTGAQNMNSYYATGMMFNTFV